MNQFSLYYLNPVRTVLHILQTPASCLMSAYNCDCMQYTLGNLDSGIWRLTLQPITYMTSALKQREIVV